MSDLPLDETALQAAITAQTDYVMAHIKDGKGVVKPGMEAAISTYMAAAGFKVEEDGPHFGEPKPPDRRRQVGPWKPIPVVQAESEEE